MAKNIVRGYAKFSAKGDSNESGINNPNGGGSHNVAPGRSFVCHLASRLEALHKN
jgi:hypothetical protein